MIPSEAEFLAAYHRLRPHVHRTPVLSSTSLNERMGAKVFLKCENFQRMGAFKMRGACNAIMSLSEGEKARGVATHSSGNFAQAVSLAAREQQVKAYIVMPETAPSVKVAAVKGYGGEVIICGPTLSHREAATHEVIDKTGATFIHPSNDIPVIMGQGSAAIELLEEQPDLDVLITPVGGGGLLAGTALAVKYLAPEARVIAGEPFGADDAYHSLKAGKIIPPENPNTIADGLRTSLGDKNFPIIQDMVSEIIRVEEQEILDAMYWIWERMKIIIEPSSAVPIAALIRQKSDFEGLKIGVIISGGNVDLQKIPFLHQG